MNFPTRAICIISILLLLISFSATADIIEVDPISGTDGATPPYKTITYALAQAQAGDTISLLPGVYREIVDVRGMSNIIITASAGKGTAFISGGIPSSSLVWERLSDAPSNNPGILNADLSNIWYATLSQTIDTQWPAFLDPNSGDEYPEYIVELNNNNEVISRLPHARTPNWVDPFTVDSDADGDYNNDWDDWHYHKDWYTADGGDEEFPGPYLPSDFYGNNSISQDNNSATHLTDSDTWDFNATDDVVLSALGALTNGQVFILDNKQAHYKQRCLIEGQNGDTIVTRDSCSWESSYGSIGVYTKYFLEGLPQFIDEEDEWYVDRSTGRLFIYSLSNPASRSLEIAQKRYLVRVADTRDVTFENLTIYICNRAAMYGYNGNNDVLRNVRIEGCTLSHAPIGFKLRQDLNQHYGSPSSNAGIYGLYFIGNDVGFTDDEAFSLDQFWQGKNTDTMPHQGLHDIYIENNEFHHAGYRATGLGVYFSAMNDLVFRGNYVHDIAHNGVQFCYSPNTTGHSYPMSDEDIGTGGILIESNLFERCCMNQCDAGSLKFWGDWSTDTVIYKDVLIVNNIFRYTRGWTAVNEYRGNYCVKDKSSGSPSDPSVAIDEHAFEGGQGLYFDVCGGGFYIFKNIFYGNGNADFKFGYYYRNGTLIAANNVFGDARRGYIAGNFPVNTSYDALYPTYNNQFYNNIFFTNEMNAYSFCGSDFDSFSMDYNMYAGCGTRLQDAWGWGIMYHFPADNNNPPYTLNTGYARTIADVQAKSSNYWENNGIEVRESGVVLFYNAAEHDYHYTQTSPAIDAGKIPVDMTNIIKHLATEYGITAHTAVVAYDGNNDGTVEFDIGPYEFEFIPEPGSVLLLLFLFLFGRYSRSVYPSSHNAA